MAIFKIFSFKSKCHKVLIELNKKVEFISPNYESRVECLKVINSIRRNSTIKKAYEIQELDCGSWCFILKDITRNVPIGRSSETYIDRVVVEEKTKLMRKYAANAKIDNTVYKL